MSSIDTDVDSFSTVHVDHVKLSTFVCTNIEVPVENSHGDLENVFDVNPSYAILSSVSFLEVYSSAMRFDKFMTKGSHDLPPKQTLIVVQIETSPRVTIVVEAKLISSQTTIAISNVNSLELLPWLSSITPKRKKQEISPNIFDF